MRELDKFKKEIPEIGKRLYDKGFTPGASGNISIKFENYVLITPSGLCLGELSESDIVVLDIEGNIVEGSQKPSSEREMHLEIYRTRPDISSIIHAHPPKSTSFAVAGIPLVNPILSEVVVVIGQVPIADYATPSSKKLASIVAESFTKNDTVLMANHGVVIGGKKLKETFYKIETLELYAEISLWTKLLGKSNEISEENVRELVEIREKLTR